MYIYAADVWCDDCAEEIKRRLVDHDSDSDSDDYPKGPYLPEAADSPQHCAAGCDCLNAISLGGVKVGDWLENDLTRDGVQYVAEAMADGGEVAKFWRECYPEVDPKDFPIVPRGLQEFFDAYIECALWSEHDQSTPQGGEPFDANYGPEDIAEESLNEMREECRQFMLDNVDDIGGNYAQAGHDFWLTRNGHGAGFWDGDWPEAGQRLTQASKVWGESYLYLGDDGLVYAG